MALPPLSLKGRALRLLAMREHSRAELERKLASHAQSPGELSRVLDELHSKGFISAQRVADSVLHRRSARVGSARIRQELQQKGLDPEVIESAMASLRGSELERARTVWRKKFGGEHAAQEADSAQRARQMRFLASRGFSGDTIRRVLGGADDESAPD